jgi:hypothetical protein
MMLIAFISSGLPGVEMAVDNLEAHNILCAEIAQNRAEWEA